MGLVEERCEWVFWVVGGLWRVGAAGRGGWIKESVNLVSVGGWVCVCVVLSVGLGQGWTQCLPQGVGAPQPCCGNARLASPKNWEAGPPERRGRWIQFAQCSPNSPPDCGTVAHQPRAGCIRLVLHEVFKRFIKYMNVSKNNPDVLVMDNHESHLRH